MEALRRARGRAQGNAAGEAKARDYHIGLNRVKGFANYAIDL